MKADTHASGRPEVRPRGKTITPPAAGGIGAEVRGVDLLSTSDDTIREIQDCVYRHKLVVFRDQHLSDEEYIAVAKRFGTPQIYFQPNYHHPKHPEIFVSSNVKVDGRKVGVAGTGRYWHTDYQFFEEPLSTTMIYPKQLPSTHRETFYIDMERVLRELPAELRVFTEGTRCRHEAKWRYKVQAEDIDKSITEILEEFGQLTPTVSHPTAIRHPVTGSKSLYVSEGFTVGIDGMSHEEGKAALIRLFEFSQRDEYIHTHHWRNGDILFWDNRPLLHKASTVPKGQPSVSYRIGVYDGLPFYVT